VCVREEERELEGILGLICTQENNNSRRDYIPYGGLELIRMRGRLMLLPSEVEESNLPDQFNDELSQK
jgi:hypothetical protein